MPDLNDGESVEIKGSARLPYVLKNTGGVYSCTCPACSPDCQGTQSSTGSIGAAAMASERVVIFG